MIHISRSARHTRYVRNISSSRCVGYHVFQPGWCSFTGGMLCITTGSDNTVKWNVHHRSFTYFAYQTHAHRELRWRRCRTHVLHIGGFSFVYSGSWGLIHIRWMVFSDMTMVRALRVHHWCMQWILRYGASVELRWYSVLHHNRFMQQLSCTTLHNNGPYAPCTDNTHNRFT